MQWIFFITKTMLFEALPAGTTTHVMKRRLTFVSLFIIEYLIWVEYLAFEIDGALRGQFILLNMTL